MYWERKMVPGGRVRVSFLAERSAANQKRRTERQGACLLPAARNIAGEKRVGSDIFYTLGFPNCEVRSALSKALLGTWIGGKKREGEHRMALFRALQKNDFTRIREIFFSLYAGIPHDWFRNNRIDEFECYYASVFYASFAALGLEIVPEDVSNQGQLDMAVKFNGQVYLFEFKVVEEEAEGKALAQIKEKGYADKYRALDQPIHLIGVEFSKKQRNVVAFAVESPKPGVQVNRSAP